jgi:hypothetical protein
MAATHSVFLPNQFNVLLLTHYLNVKVMLRPTVSHGVMPPSGAQHEIFMTVSCGFVDVGRPLKREAGVVYNCSWPSPA